MTSTAVPATDRATPSPRGRGGVGPRLAAAALVIGGVLNTTEAVLAQFLPERPSDTADGLRYIAENGTLYGIRGVIGTLAIPFMAIAFLAVAQLLGRRSPFLGWTSGGLLLAGMWGFLGVHVLGLAQLPAAELGNHQASAAVLDAIEGHPVLLVLFLLPFLAGCAVGMVLLAAGIIWTRVLPRWIGVAWLVFILVDFTVGAVGPVDPHWLFLLGAVGAAVSIVQPARRTAVEARQ